MNPAAKFLIVDDMRENLLALQGLLRRDGLEILEALSGPEALEILLSEDVALAILDVQMPGMDGFELAELMRNSSRTKHIPIIFLTAGALDDRRRFRGYETGAVDFLYKPVEPEILKSKAGVFFDLYVQRQEVIRQRDQLKEAAEEKARLYDEIVQLNESLEERVKERTNMLMEANDQLRGFTHSIAHDFRQHIRNINVNAEIVLAEAPQLVGEYRGNIQRISHVAKLMSQMTDDLLTYARMRIAAVHPVDIDLSALAKEIGEREQNLYPRSRISVENGLNVCADRTMIRVVLENLLDNAFKYSQKAEAPFIEFGRDEEGFYVRDNGMGFDMAYVGKLFLPFERLHTGDEISGTGMGLANVKRILDRHEGAISVHSEPRHGTTFHFSVGSPKIEA